MKYDFKDKTIMISGAAGGIGRVISKFFANINANLVLIDLKEKLGELECLKKELVNKQIKISIYCLDLKKCNEIDELILKLEEDGIVIDILVNNAGNNSYYEARQISEEIWDNVVDLNLKGTFFLTRSIANYSIINRKGNIINIASQHSVVGNLKRAHYCASKGGVVNMTRALAYEWAKYDVRVNCVSPTFVLTEGNKDLLNEPYFKKQNLSKIPLRMYAVPEDVANSIVFLASPMARMITGHNLIVDGGWTIY